MTNPKNLIRLEDLPEDIQNRILQHYEEQIELEYHNQQIEKSKELANNNTRTNIVINNRNTYNTYITHNVRALRNEGTINEKKDSVLDIFARAAGRAAGKTWKWLNTEDR